MVGLSRKATVYKTLGIKAEEALNGTTVLHTMALLNGTNILRVHDVKEAIEAIKLVQKYSEI
jgi:dihydropteroate synthase